jgi:hypothetical protein
MTLWTDIPAAERMTEWDLASCRGADDPVWLKSNVDILRSPQCPAAVKFRHPFSKFGNWHKYLPCRQPPSGADGFCSFHVPAEVRAQRRKERHVAEEREVDEALRRVRERERTLLRRRRSIGAATILLDAAERLIRRAALAANRPNDWWVGGPADIDYAVDSEQVSAAVRDEYGQEADEVVRRWFRPTNPDEDAAWQRQEEQA